MTATVSTNPNKNVKKFSPPLHNWKQNIKGSKKLAIILTVLHMIAAPAVMLAAIIFIYGGSSYDIDGIEIIAVIATALAGFLGIFPAVNSFSCLNDKTVVDMRLSLPMTAAQRFVSNFLSGLFTYIAPFLSAQVFSILFALYGRIFMDGRTFYRITYDGLNKIRTPYVCDVFAEALPALLKLILGGLLAMLMLYTVTVLITACCGSKFESIAYSVLINILIPSTVLCVTYSIFDDLYGVDPSLSSVKLIMYTTTAGGVMAAMDWAISALGGNSIIGYATNGLINYGVWALIYLLVIAALFALAFFLYRKRRAEQVSKPFVFKLVYYITVTCGIFCIVSLALGDLGLPATVILTAVMYLIFEVITNRGFKRIWLSMIKYVLTFLGAWAVIVIGVKTDGFGTVYRVPAAATVTSAEIYYGGLYGDFYEIGKSYSMDMPIVIKDKENIKTIISAHKTAVQDYKGYKDNADIYSNSIPYAPLTIKYNLIGGGSLYRQYGGLCSEAVEILTAIDISEEYKTQVAEIYKQNILAIPDEYNKTIEYYIKDYIPTNEQNYYAYVLNRMLLDEDNTNVTVSSLCARGFYEKLADAYYNDIMAINEENYFRSELKNVWTLYTFTNSGRYTSNPTLTVPESFENTVALLDNFDFNLIRIETADERDITDSLIKAASSGYVNLYTESEWRAMNYCEEGALHARWSWTAGGRYESYVYDFDDNFIELFRSAMPRNIVSENGYIISVYNFSGAVPEEMNEAAAAVTRTGRDEKTEELYNEIAYGESKQYYD